MNKNRVILAASLAILTTPSILSSVDSVAHVAEPISVKAANTSNVGTLGYDVKVVDINGNDTGIVLPAGSSWQLGKLVNIKGNNYYQVATNEYALAIVMKSNTNTASPEVIPVDMVITLSADEVSLFDDNTSSLGRSLPVNSSWRVDQVKVIGTNRYYRLATNEWVKVSYIENNKTITPTLKSNQQVYNTATGAMDRTLPADSSWKVSKVVRNSKNVFWGQVSTNEWIKLDAKLVTMSYGDADSIPSIAVSEPNFALNF